MEARPRIVRAYKTLGGRKPFWEWLHKLKDKKARSAVRARLSRFRQGNLGGCKPLSHGIHEAKIDYGPGYRVYFGNIKDTVIILLCGGDKQTQKKDIKKAQEYWAEFKSRK